MPDEQLLKRALETASGRGRGRGRGKGREDEEGMRRIRAAQGWRWIDDLICYVDIWLDSLVIHCCRLPAVYDTTSSKPLASSCGLGH